MSQALMYPKPQLEGEAQQREASYWRHQLAGLAPFVELPTDRPRPVHGGGPSARVRTMFPAALIQRLGELCARRQATLFCGLLAGLKALLYHHSGREDLAVGTPATDLGGDTAGDLTGLAGNMLVLRTDLSGDPSFWELLGRVQEVALGASTHQGLPFEKFLEELGPEQLPGRTALFQVAFVLRHAGLAPRRLPGLGASDAERVSWSVKLDLALTMTETEEGFEGEIEYRADLFNATTMRRFLGHLRRFLNAAVAEPDRRIGSLPLLSAGERQQLNVEWSDTATVYPQARLIHQIFEGQVDRSPDAVAICSPGHALSYGELDRRANAVAHYLRSLGVGPEVLVGICTTRSPDAVVALLGILKAGGAYLPLDPEAPSERLAFVVRDAGVRVVLSQTALLDRLRELIGDLPLTSIEDAVRHGGPGTSRPVTSVTWDHLVYVIYTSGSTGEPKGAMLTHRAARNRLLWGLEQELGGCSDHRVLHIAPLSFDVSVWEIFGPLLIGARLVIARPGGQRDIGYLLRLIANEGVTHLDFVPSMLQIFLEEETLKTCRSLRRLVSGGEALSPELALRAQAQLSAQITNLYGPTEAAIDVACWHLRGQEHLSVPIGRPLTNTRIDLLDRRAESVPVGVTGELCAGGTQLARGYLRRPKLTAEKFVPDPRSGVPGARLYRTGDLARNLPDGTVDFLGRRDHQVQLRGVRIELGEVESVLCQHPQVREAAALIRQDAAGEPHLTAYVVGNHGRAPGAAELRQFLGARLPSSMVPSGFITLEALPLNRSGKVNRRSLPVVQWVSWPTVKRPSSP